MITRSRLPRRRPGQARRRPIPRTRRGMGGSAARSLLLSLGEYPRTGDIHRRGGSSPPAGWLRRFHLGPPCRLHVAPPDGTCDGSMWPRFKRQRGEGPGQGRGPHQADTRLPMIRVGPLQGVQVVPTQAVLASGPASRAGSCPVTHKSARCQLLGPFGLCHLSRPVMTDGRRYKDFLGPRGSRRAGDWQTSSNLWRADFDGAPLNSLPFKKARPGQRRIAGRDACHRTLLVTACQ